LQIDGKSHAARNVALIGGGAAAGAILGGLAGGGKGALIGTAAGAGAGTATAYITGKQELVLPAEMRLTFVVAGAAVRAPERSDARVEWNVRVGRDDSEYDAYDRDTYDRYDYDRDNRYDRYDRDDHDRYAYDRLRLTDRQQRTIRAYFRSGNGRGLPPGLAKRNGDLPRGLEKQLRRNGTLPPGLHRHVEPFPWDLDRQLPPLPRGASRVIVSGRAMVLVNDTIVDIMVII
jgi:hypothetical protein